MVLIGQEKITEFVNSVTIDSMPKSLLLLGAVGCGKHTALLDISNTLQLNIENITDKISLEYLENCSLNTQPTIYLLEADRSSKKDQNMLLKFIEEPSAYSFIVVIANRLASVIPTIRNRCINMQFEPYSKNTLKQFIVGQNCIEDTLTICKTPGDIIKCNDLPVSEMFLLANKIFDCIANANIANTFTLTNKLAFDNEKDLFDVDIFSRVLMEVSSGRILRNEKFCFEYFKATTDFRSDIKKLGANKRFAFEKFLLKLKEYK